MEFVPSERNGEWGKSRRWRDSLRRGENIMGEGEHGGMGEKPLDAETRGHGDAEYQFRVQRKNECHCEELWVLAGDAAIPEDPSGSLHPDTGFDLR